MSLFLDTNVIVYAHDSSEPAKQAIAQSLITGSFPRGRSETLRTPSLATRDSAA